jgi:hypothetical protein
MGEGSMKVKWKNVWRISAAAVLSAAVVLGNVSAVRAASAVDGAVESADNSSENSVSTPGDGIETAADSVSTPGNGTETTGEAGSTTETGAAEDGEEADEVTIVRIKEVYKRFAAGKKISLSEEVSTDSSGNANFIWTSSNTKYATVSQEGIVKTKKAGAGNSVTVTAKATDRSGRRVVFKIEIMTGAVQKVSAKASKSTVKAGDSVKIQTTVKATKGANRKLSFTSSKKKYATVTSKGVVQTYEAGKGKTVKITVAATDGSGKKATVKIKIK